MIWLKIIAWGLVVLGLIGAILPVLPGPVLVWLGAFLLAWVQHFQGIGWGTLAVLGVLTLLSWVIETLAAYVGAKAGGASWWGVLGGLLGMLLGLLVANLVGALLGAIIGIFLVEWAQGRSKREAFRGSLGYLAGYVVSIFAELGITLLMIAILLTRR